MTIIQKVWAAMHSRFLGGNLVSTYGAVKGEVAVGTTGDLQKASGEIRVHLVRTKRDQPIVTVELLQDKLPDDSSDMICVRLAPSEAAHLGCMLREAAVS